MTAIKGYPSSAKEDRAKPDYATISPYAALQFGLDVLAHTYVYLVTADAVEAGSTTKVLNATAHSALPGDLLSFTSGALSGIEVRVADTTTNTITMAVELISAPAAAVTFDILRNKTPVASSSGSVVVSSSAAPGRSFVSSARNDYSITAVTTGAWVQLIASTAAASNGIFLFDSSGSTMELGLGAAASETRLMLVPPGGVSGFLPILIPAGSRLSVRAVSGTANSGEITTTLLS